MKMDLNLFRVFDVLMELRSVSRSADRLGVTQSAVSHALARLREQLDDPLFVRTRGELTPTARAREIAPAIRDGLSLLREATSQPDFDPATTSRAFTLGAGIYFCTTMLPGVVERMRREAPNAQLRVVAPGEDSMAGIDEGTIDLVLSSLGRLPGRLAHEPLFTERMVWVGRAGSTAGDLAGRPRLAISIPQRPVATDDVMLRADHEQIGTGRFATVPAGPSLVTIHDALSAGMIVSRTDLVTQLPGQLARRLSEHAGVAMLGPGDVPPIEIAMFWHPRVTTDPAHAWLRGLFRDAAASMD